MIINNPMPYILEIKFQSFVIYIVINLNGVTLIWTLISLCSLNSLSEFFFKLKKKKKDLKFLKGMLPFVTLLSFSTRSFNKPINL
jgi:hypothetical protein